MPYCPSQDWDRHVCDEEAGQIGQWLLDVSKQISVIDPYWNAEDEALDAIGDDAEVRWSCGIDVIVPYTDDLENDDVALVIRTLHEKGRRFKVFALPTQMYGIFAFVPTASPAWRIVPNSEQYTLEQAKRYLEFACSDQDIYKETPTFSASGVLATDCQG